MKTLQYLSFITFAVVLFAAGAAGQAHSIKSVAADAKFHSADDGFEIALPAGPEKKEIDGARGYLWDFSDGSIAISVENAKRPFKTAEDIEAFIADYKEHTINKNGGKIVNESPAKIGEYHGAVFVIDAGDAKVISIILGWDKFDVKLVAHTTSKDPAVQQAYVAALQSFSFVH